MVVWEGKRGRGLRSCHTRKGVNSVRFRFQKRDKDYARPSLPFLTWQLHKIEQIKNMNSRYFAILSIF